MTSVEIPNSELIHFKEQVKKNSSNENSNQSTGSVENSILEKIKKR